MKFSSLIIFIYLLVFCLSFLNSQPIYFNNTYNLCAIYNPEAWSVAEGILEQQDGYVLCGATVDTVDFWMRRIPLMKIGFDGEIIWKKDFGDPESDFYTGWSNFFIESNDNHYYISGSINYWQPSNYDVGLLMKLDDQFEIIWTKKYDLNLDEQKDTSLIFNQMDTCFNGDLIFGGSMNGSHMLLWRTDSSGITRWYKLFHYGSNTLCTGYSVIQTSDNGFALGGFMYTIGQPETGNSVIVKTDSSGNQEWVKFLGGPYLDNTAMLSRSPDGNIIMGTAYGESMSGHNPISRIYIARLNNAGNILWEYKYGESQKFNYLINIRTLEDGSIISSGSSYDISSYFGWILKVDMNGDSVWYRKKRILPYEYSLHYLIDIIPTSDKGYITCGYVSPIYPDTGIQSAWVIKLDSLGCDSAGCDTTVGIEEQRSVEAGRQGGVDIWPNPSHDWITLTLPDVAAKGAVELVVYDIYGREAGKRGSEEAGMRGNGGVIPVNRMILLDISDYSPGIYIAVIKDRKGRRFTGKFVAM